MLLLGKFVISHVVLLVLGQSCSGCPLDAYKIVFIDSTVLSIVGDTIDICSLFSEVSYGDVRTRTQMFVNQPQHNGCH